MPIIYVSTDVPDGTFEKIKTFAASAVCENTLGILDVERDDFTHVDCRDEYEGVSLLGKVNAIIDGRDS